MFGDLKRLAFYDEDSGCKRAEQHVEPTCRVSFVCMSVLSNFVH